MRFGFDIDDTLINLREHAFNLYNQKLNQRVGLDVFQALKTVQIHEAFGLQEADGNAMWESLMEEIYFSDCPPFEGAIELLNELSKEGHEIYYITSRPKKYCSQTRNWMKARNFPVADGQFYCGMQDHEKMNIINNLALDYYFDDKPAVLETLDGSHTKVFVKDQSYNQHIGIPRIQSWTQFKESIWK